MGVSFEDRDHQPVLDRRVRIGILWRADSHDPSTHLHPLFGPLTERFAKAGITAVPVLYSDDALEEAKLELLRLGAVLVWVDPISNGRNRSQLDALLREVSARGVFVSAHPDVILKLGTKEVLHQTRALGWGTDTRLYTSAAQFEAEFPRVLGASGPRVLKQNRGNGGIGVFRVDLVRPAAVPGPGTLVRVQHAQRGSPREEIGLGEFMHRCRSYFDAEGRIVDQPFQARHAEGMVRCYVVRDRVAGFGHQLVTALMDPAPGEAAPPIPTPRLYSGPDNPEFQNLKVKLESDWIHGMQSALAIETAALPLLWDADFLLGPKTASGEDTYVLCEINSSSVHPFPDEALEPLVRAALTRIQP